MSTIQLRYRLNQQGLSIPMLTSPCHGSSYPYGLPIAVSISPPECFGQTVVESILKISARPDMANPTTYTQAYVGPQLMTLSDLSRGESYYIQCALIGSVTGQTKWSPVVKITILSVAIGDTWLFTATGSSNFEVPANGQYRLEVCGGGGGGASSWWSGAVSYGAGGGGGYVQIVTSLCAGDTLQCIVGGGGTVATATAAVQRGGSGGTSQITGIDVPLCGYGGSGGYADMWSATGGAGGETSGGEGVHGSPGGNTWGLYDRDAWGGKSAIPPYGNGGDSRFKGGSWLVYGGTAGMVRITLSGV